MKKILAKIQKWWYFTFLNPVEYRFEVGGFKVVFRRFWLEIESMSKNFKVRFLASEHPYGYLFVSCKNGKLDNVHGYCAFIYKLSHCLTTDNKFVEDINRAISNYDKRLAAKAVTNVSTDNDDIDLEVVKQNDAVGKMTKKEREARKKELKKSLRDE
jgi:hypothetical protein